MPLATGVFTLSLYLSLSRANPQSACGTCASSFGYPTRGEPAIVVLSLNKDGELQDVFAGMSEGPRPVTPPSAKSAGLCTKQYPVPPSKA